MRRTSLQSLAFAALLLALGLGVARLFGMRDSRGDVYPRYSTLRSDPLGARLLFEALRRIDGLTVLRNTGPPAHLWKDPAATLFVLGAEPSLLEAGASDEAIELEALIRHGLRSVITIVPVRGPPPAREDERSEKRAPDGKETGRHGVKKKMPPPFDETFFPEESRRASLNRLLGFEVTRVPLPLDEGGEPMADVARRQGTLPEGVDLPERIPWHTTLCFADLAGDWRVIYARAGHPVLIERDLGRGSLVLSADSYLLSNEALSLEPRAALVSWLIGGHGAVVFDETHLGIEERPGVAALMRRYGLHGFIAAVLLLGVLFVWRASVSFIPPHEEPGAAAADMVPGRDAAAGLGTLLRRGIPRSDILRVCREEWTKTFQHRRPDLVTALEAWTDETADPVETYRRISRTLQEMRITYER
jgi:hypothetical protein